ncbi:hypothetical protein Nepgr_027205 [Nepenthes gracilis]|uniref:Uncharacterized protein n=1 Tax=Nepenthes gracilis TaxID=150966 RepID=A0AAD3Y119_NEPGR|nr:hypothetical protein Nepgr_027205 [Nepenthes gracilis]
MNRVEREDIGYFQEPARKVEPVSALVQTPSYCSSLLPNLETQNCRHQLLQEAQSSSQAGLVVRNGCERKVEIVYHSKPAHRNTHTINSKKWVAKSLNQQPNCPLAPALGSGSHVGEVVHPSDQVLVTEALVDASSAHVEPSRMGLVLCSSVSLVFFGVLDSIGAKLSSLGVAKCVAETLAQFCTLQSSLVSLLVFDRRIGITRSIAAAAPDLVGGYCFV